MRFFRHGGWQADSLPRWALANPDFVERFRHRAPLNELDPTTLYGGGAVGCTDYATMDARAVAIA